MDRLYKCDANYTALTPITFLKRASMVYADRTSIIYGEAKFTWSQTYDRCRRLASSLQSLGVAKNDVVSVLAPNIPALYESHFAVPMAGAVLNTINSMLDANTIKTILNHSEAKIIFVDYEYLPKALDALTLLKNNSATNRRKPPSVIIINEIGYPPYKDEVGTGVRRLHDFVAEENSQSMHNIDYHPLNLKHSNKLDYEQLILLGNPNFEGSQVVDEWDPIALNYTSGTTSAPKGVVYSHRGAYLSTLSMVLGWEMGTEPVYLWSLPMFHCNGWTFTWGIAARGGTNVCIRKTTASEIYNSVALHNVTHMCCAPVVFNMIRAEPVQMRSKVQVLTGGAPPPATLLEEMEGLGFDIVHAYGLTEATGPALLCEWQTKWDSLPREDKSQLKARQGISVLTVADVDVKDLNTKESVLRDGKAVGEIVIRGSGIMKGYFKDEKATSEAFENGWFHTGDLGVVYPDGYIEIKDRLKDVIISGGENISSVEVEGLIFQHPKVEEVAVVAMPHPRWGESPCAFVVKKAQCEDVTEQEIFAHCRRNLTHYMLPKKVVFVEQLPKTSTGKVQKPILRAIAKKFQVENSKGPHQIVAMSRL